MMSKVESRSASRRYCESTAHLLVVFIILYVTLFLTSFVEYSACDVEDVIA
jgi:hypothetical protein